MSNKMPSQIFQPYKGLAAFSATMGPPALVVHHVRLVVPPNTEQSNKGAANILREFLKEKEKDNNFEKRS